MLSIEQQQLVEDNIGLVGKTIQKYYPQYAWDEDIYQIGCEGLIKAAINFNPEISKISTYGPLCIRNTVWNYIQGQQKQCRMVNHMTTSLEMPIGEDGHSTLKDLIEHPVDHIEGVISNDLIARELDKLTAKEFKVVNLVMLDVGTQEDIANMLSISQPTVTRRLASARVKLRGLIA